MAKLYYRGMADQNGKPKIGRSARLLGVRLNIDIDIESRPIGWVDERSYLRPAADRDDIGKMVVLAVKNAKGMSVSLAISGLPAFRKPPTFGGTGRDPLWQIDDRNITGDLEAVQDSPTHVSILPSATMLLAQYEAALAGTQNDWERVERVE